MKLKQSYLQKLEKKLEKKLDKKEQKWKTPQPVFFKLNALNWGEIDWSKTMAYANSPY